MEESLVVRADQLLLWVDELVGVDAPYLIVAAQEGEARPVPDPLHLVFGLVGGARDERGIARIHRAGEHEILPDEKAELVAEVVEVLGLIYPSAPNPDHVHVCRDRGLEVARR